MGAVWMGASMGPQLGSCGRPSATRPWPSAWRCFNGAATWQLRKGHARTARQDGHGASMGPQLDSCGRRRSRPRLRDPPDASMGPQLDSCGRLANGRARPLNTMASMGPQPSSCGRDPADKIGDGRGLASTGPQPGSCGRRFCTIMRFQLLRTLQRGGVGPARIKANSPLLSQKYVALPPPPTGGRRSHKRRGRRRRRHRLSRSGNDGVWEDGARAPRRRRRGCKGGSVRWRFEGNSRERAVPKPSAS